MAKLNGLYAQEPLNSEKAAPQLEEHGIAAVSGPRKLVRPPMSEAVLARNSIRRRQTAPVLAHHEAMAPRNAAHHDSHAEIFYFQKQMQAQTAMIFVLEDGERIEGVIEWFDQNVVKVRNQTRMLIYKTSIKYLFKANENQD